MSEHPYTLDNQQPILVGKDYYFYMRTCSFNFAGCLPKPIKCRVYKITTNKCIEAMWEPSMEEARMWEKNANTVGALVDGLWPNKSVAPRIRIIAQQGYNCDINYKPPPKRRKANARGRARRRKR